MNCKHSKRCGACDLIDVPYDVQLKQKQASIEELFGELAPADSFLPILGMDDPTHYRNKVASPFAPGNKRKGEPPILTGMYERGTHHLVNTDGCLVDSEIGNRVVVAVRQIMQKYKMEPYNEDTGRGFIRHVITRVGHGSGEVLVTIVTNGDEFPSSKAFCRELVKRVPEITTVVQNINTRKTNVILGDQERTLYGPGFILDKLCELSFRISSRSFYQVNARQTEVLYTRAIEMAKLDGDSLFLDTYCGISALGLLAAKRGAARVIGVDSVESAIADARLNAKHNGITNAEFVAQDATEFMTQLAKTQEVNSENLVLMMDPPRAGSTPEFLDAAAALAPVRIVYISCNPQTQARDVNLLLARGYQVEAIQPVDMFPHTNHIENIVALVKD